MLPWLEDVWLDSEDGLTIGVEVPREWTFVRGGPPTVDEPLIAPDLLVEIEADAYLGG